ncbi:translocation/assembly module TamB domain-containing protein [Parabacteroides sp. PF5-9]|uniref:translocation/assembly module TamB domain-containing protein n=1 Tax=Parabacteroides sp. PF5-9 TaxID=1742404 RepID=UPI00247596A2|nr:translocation/assembly module TamB domain-containing protein [Parabacteroides sp. PF5-9]MDH6357978.1 hypothetical protein [Parabacteroides sp. PF5-9]
MRRLIKWVGIICLIPIVLVLFVIILLYIPPIQNVVVQKATRYASKATGMHIQVEKIRLSFPLDLSIYETEILTSSSDTILTLERLTISLNPIPLLHKVVSVESIEFENAHINTGSLIEGAELRGTIQQLSARADRIDLIQEKATLNALKLSDSAITLKITATEKEETAVSEPLNWILNLEKIDFEHLCLALQMPEDSLRISTYIDRAGLSHGAIDLATSHYEASRFELSRSVVNYDGDERIPQPGFDPAHIALDQLNIAVESIVYHDRAINVDIKEFAAEERSGLNINALHGNINSDSTTIQIPELILKTPDSEIAFVATIPWSVFEEQSKGSLNARLTASLGENDIFTGVQGVPTDLIQLYPNHPLSLTVGVEGNLNLLTLRQLKVELPDALTINISGKMEAVMDSIRRTADLNIHSQTGNLDFLLGILPTTQRDQFRIPQDITLSGNLGLHDQELHTHLQLTEDKGQIDLVAQYHLVQEAYSVALNADSLEPVHFMPGDSLLWVSANLKIEGQGTDLFADSTWATINGRISDIQYGTMHIADVTLEGALKEHQTTFRLKSEYPVAHMDISFDGSIRKEETKGMLIMDVDSLDLYALHLIDRPLSTSFQLFGEAQSDLEKEHKVDITIGNWDLNTSDMHFNPKMLTLFARTDKDTTRLSLHSGDLGIVLTGNGDLETMIDQLAAINDEVNLQLKEDSTVNIAGLRPALPDLTLTINAEKENPLYTILRQYDILYNTIQIKASTSPENGLLMDAGLFGLRRDTLQFDTIMANIRPDSTGLLFGLRVAKNRYRQQMPFTAEVRGSVGYRYANAEFLYTNHLRETGLLVGVRIQQISGGFRFQLYPEEVVLAFNPFKLNPDNYLLFKSMQEIEADIRFTGPRNASLWIHSMPGAGDYPELHAELSQIDLDVVSKGFAELPLMKGILSADLQYAPIDNTFMVVADVNVDELYYENGRVGEMMLNAVYLPLENAQHQVDVHLYHDQSEISSAYALLHTGKQTTSMQGTLNVSQLPLDMLNPFIPGRMAHMDGAMNGEVSIAGSTVKPVLDGFIQLDSSSVYLGMADTRLRFDNKRITVDKSLITLNKYNIYSAGNNPFVIDGNIDLSNLSRMRTDLKMTAQNMQVLEAKRTKESLVYGRLLMNFDTTIKGPFNGLVVRGDAHLLGGTDMTYVLTDSPLSIQDRMDGLVTFTSFTDTLTRRRRNQAATGISGMDMLMALHIDPTVQMRVDLTPDQSNFVEVEGGGDLTFQMNKQGDMVLNGRYTFSEGIVKYALPVVPLKEFNIHQGSSVQWDGEIMNPRIDVMATERMRATITRDGNQRRANFDVGISIQERLDNMNMTFIINAVDDQQSMTELASLGEDERTRWAVYMMITGSYMGSGSGVNVDAVISNFLMGEVNNIAGDVLKGVDINLGLDTYESEGQTQRDLTFSFSKRFYNDRIRVTVGGKVAMENQQQAESFLDNFAAEYLLDVAGSKTVKFFYDRNYDMLEGEVVQTGVGLVLRKKVLHLRELFDFRKKKTTPVTEKEEETVDDE